MVRQSWEVQVRLRSSLLAFTDPNVEMLQFAAQRTKLESCAPVPFAKYRACYGNLEDVLPQSYSADRVFPKAVVS